MMRVVRAADKRAWTVQSRISWTRPAMTAQFEHDMAAGYVSGIAMLGVVVVLTLFVVFWTPASVVVPAWFVLLILLMLLVLSVSWAMQRHWIITADTAEPIETEGEHWEGIVRGILPAREESHRVADCLRRRSIPDDGTGSLTRVQAPSAPFRDS
jgi:hypothetical protein